MAENHHFFQPLLSGSTSGSPDAPTATPPPDCHRPISSNHGIVLRLALVIFVGIVSVWANFSRVMSQIVQQSMVHIWMWDGQGKAPKNLINGIAGYVARNLHTPHVRINSKGSEPVKPASMCNLKHEEPSAVAEFLDYWEGVRPGFIRRLNQGMKGEWDDGKLEMALMFVQVMLVVKVQHLQRDALVVVNCQVWHCIWSK